ncbi:MAG: hypothetical protein ACTSUE_10735 [Promethearchaeota archaeon]
MFSTFSTFSIFQSAIHSFIRHVIRAVSEISLGISVLTHFSRSGFVGNDAESAGARLPN